MSFANITYRSTNSVGIEYPSRRTLNTSSLIPSFASWVSRSVKSSRVKLTSSVVFVEEISSIAAQTASIRVMTLAEVRDGLTDTISIRVPVE